MSRAPLSHDRLGNGDEQGQAASHLRGAHARTPPCCWVRRARAPREQAPARPRHAMEQSHADTPVHKEKQQPQLFQGWLKKAVAHPTAKGEQLQIKWQVKLFFCHLQQCWSSVIKRELCKTFAWWYLAIFKVLYVAVFIAHCLCFYWSHIPYKQKKRILFYKSSYYHNLPHRTTFF